LVIVVIWFIPDQLITSIFSKEFGNLKVLFLVLSPGILAIAVTNIFGHYFAAKNRQGILILKSFIGFLCSLILTPVFIELYHFWGAALAMSVSYLVSSVILVFAYIKEIRTNKNSLLY
jgi:O-antigen/teichoic acid export membrane protein